MNKSIFIVCDSGGAESELSERCGDKAVGTGQRELSRNNIKNHEISQD